MLNWGMAALGALLGLLIAWSASPIVATLLPLLFGLVGGASGFSILKMDLTKAGAQQKIKIIGGALLSCCLACIVTLLAGVATRGYFVTLQAETSIHRLSKEDLSHRSYAIDELLLRKRLTSIGATKLEIQALMQNSASTADLKAVIDQISAAESELETAYGELSDAEMRQAGGDLDQSKFAGLYSAARVFALLKAPMSANGPVTLAGFHVLTNNLYGADFTSIIPQGRDSKVFTDHPKLVAAIAKLQTSLEKQDSLSDPAAQTRKIDEFLKIIAAAKPGPDIPVIANEVIPPTLEQFLRGEQKG